VNIIFYLSAVVAIVSSFLVITRQDAVHALLYLVASFMAVALMIFTLGAPFIAILEVIVYAGAIMVLFLFAVMLLNPVLQASENKRQTIKGGGWIGPAFFSLILLGELIYILANGHNPVPPGQVIDPLQVGTTLFSTYLIGVELASILLLAALVGANHIGQQRKELSIKRQEENLLVIQKATEPISEEKSPQALDYQKEL
jgi:NADH-quinone oxidoreductase subunit J